ncbi:YkvI family membrane protein [Desulfotomaculum copahuensis]|uniref:Transporter n=1 Tax=Desulfotomaculum copahuensis TaxID=1838280 RepID=A0A1B7LAU5_9FIRM|nr:hypothetical protein [Desulfotomaculum copahuensis]OAT79472.1 hypothetical protein A6M21_15830 [Desulfotomaculum copahuensis]
MPENKTALVFKIIALYAGTVIGAGFASGQEIMQFFIKFGSRGLAGMILSGLIFGYLGLILMTLSTSRRTGSYADLLPLLMGEKLARFIDLVSLFMLPGGLAVMLAGSGAVLHEQIGLAPMTGAAAAAIITAAVILGGLQGVALVNMVVVPVKIIILILVCTLSLHVHGIKIPQIDPVAGTKASFYWAWSALLYVSYNMIVPVAMLSSLGAHVPGRAGALGGLAGGLLLGLLGLLITLTGLAFYPAITGCQVPLLFVAGQLGSLWQHGLGLLIWLAILTTAIANVHGFASRLAPRGGWPYRVLGLLTIAAVYPLARLNFAGLVQILYPVFGYAGLVLMLALLLAPVRELRRRRL